MKEIAFNKYSEKIMDLIKTGAFLTTLEEDGKVNTMTIGWGNIGIVWRKPVFTALIRHSRLSHIAADKNSEFTISVPFEDMKKTLAFCGTKSGRDFDKLKECGLKTVPSKNIKTPILDIKGVHFECKVLYKQDMDSKLFLNEKIMPDCYPNGDLHTFYYAEIVATYEK